MVGVLFCAEAAEGTTTGPAKADIASANDNQRPRADFALLSPVLAPSLIVEALICNVAVIAAPPFYLSIA
jgi:hypothetical protein